LQIRDLKFENCLYEGRVFHIRNLPKKHSFKYSVFSVQFDLCKIQKIFHRIMFFSIDKFNIFSFHHKDYGPPDCTNLERWIKSSLKNVGVKDNVNSIFLLTYPRILGYVFNPLSVYTCLNKHKKIVGQIYEVHNTFKQRHFYITRNTFNLDNHNFKISKSFHVSPFMSMEGTYKFKSFMNDKSLSIIIKYLSEKENLVASFTASKKKLSSLRLLVNFFKYPLMTIKVIAGIHIEAILLYMKGLKYFKCPKVSNNDTSNCVRKKK